MRQARCNGMHAFDPVSFVCTRRGCSARRDEPGQAYLLAPDTRPIVIEQVTMFGDMKPERPAPNPRREEPGQGALFG